MAKYSRFFMLFNETKGDPHFPYETHGELVLEFTRGATDSLRKLTEAEVRQLERRIEQVNMTPSAASAQRMRRKVIGILAARGVINAQGKPDMPHIYAWVQKYGYLHKHFNAYTIAELPKLVTQAETIVASDIKAIRNHHG